MDTATETGEETTSGADTSAGNGEAAHGASETKPLLLPSLEIKNFRAFKHLTVEKLGRVNLITGKNNVGKTSLLEALRVYSQAAPPDALREILSDRAELQRRNNPFAEDEDFEQGLDGTALFYGRVSSDKEIFFTVGEQAVASKTQTNEINFSLVLAEPLTGRKDMVKAYVFGNEISYDFDAVTMGNAHIRRRSDFALPNLFLKTRRMHAGRLAALWDLIVLRSMESGVVQALKIIDDEVEKVTFVEGEENRRVPVIKKRSEKRPLPLESFGEGFARLLTIAASLAATGNGILLIDEIENGLHYSVLPDVWRLIFQTARRLNVQVFATTHSWDCIEAFQKAASEDDDPQSGVLVRLTNKDGDVTSTVFDERRLFFVARDGIEVR